MRQVCPRPRAGVDTTELALGSGAPGEEESWEGLVAAGKPPEEPPSQAGPGLPLTSPDQTPLAQGGGGVGGACLRGLV